MRKPDAAAAPRIALVVARFNEFVTARLLAGAREALITRGVSPENVVEYWVPGAFEIPLVAAELARGGRADAIVCLGAVIRGETPHFDYVAAECAHGVAEVARTSGIPAAFGVLTTDTVEQAEARAGGRLGNKGRDAAIAALESLDVLGTIRRS